MKHEFQTILEEKIQEEKEANVRQEKLKKKFGISGKKVVVVEKDNTFKFTIKIFASVVRLAASIIILGLAFIGIIAIFYAEPRRELWLILERTITEINQMIPILIW